MHSPAARQPAEYVTTPEMAERAGQAAAPLPPLAEDDLAALVRRFRAGLAPNAKVRFDPDGWVRALNAHNESSGVRPENGRESEPGFSIVNVNNRPAWDEMYFFIEVDAAG